MRVLLALAFLLPLAAGCLDSDDGPSSSDGSPDVPTAPALAFLPPVDLVCPSEGLAAIQNQVQGDCGAFGEPVLEVAGDGAIWASATCCVGRSPPIWVSRDAGESFQLLPFGDRTGIVRDAFGIEGDFAIDDAGNVYFFDISAATTYFSKYQADGTHVFTKPDVFPPLVDRPWVRAGVADEVWIFYNTGTATNLYHSTNGGLTWTVTPVGFSCALMTFGQGPARDRLFVSGCSGAPQLSISEDGGVTFGQPILLPVPTVEGFDGQPGAWDPFMPPAADEAGNIYVPFPFPMDKDSNRIGIYLDVVHPDGSITGPILLSGDAPWCEKPWPAAGTAGRMGVAFYCADHPRDEADQATWTLKVAATTTGDAAEPAFTLVDADPEPVLKGQFGRALGDFLQSDVGPDGRFHVIYAKRLEGPLVNRVVISDGGLGFGAGVPHNGPLA